jgi:hypothetical protein
MQKRAMQTRIVQTIETVVEMADGVRLPCVETMIDGDGDRDDRVTG